MKTRTLLGMTVFLTLLLVAAVGLSQAQGSAPQGQNLALAAVSNAFTYQGRLLMDGNPVNGNCDFQFSLWDAAGSGSPPTGGNQIGSTQTKTNVAVSNGLFSVQLDFGAAAFTGDARWLQIAARHPAGSGSYTVLSPRQPLTAVPYAHSLRPGAIISGLTGSTLDVRNYFPGLFVPPGIMIPPGDGLFAYSLAGEAVHANTESGTAIYGMAEATTGDATGVHGVSDSKDGYGGYFENTGGSAPGVGLLVSSDHGTALVVTGTGTIKSSAKSYVWISGNSLVKEKAADTTRWDMEYNGSARIWRGSATGIKLVYYPIVIPGVLYGQNVRVTKLTVYYECQDGTKNYIYLTRLTRQTDAGSGETIISDLTSRQSNTATSYTLNLTTDNTLGSRSGALGLYFGLHFEDDTNYVRIGAIRLELEHD